MIREVRKLCETPFGNFAKKSTNKPFHSFIETNPYADGATFDLSDRRRCIPRRRRVRAETRYRFINAFFRPSSLRSSAREYASFSTISENTVEKYFAYHNISVRLGIRQSNREIDTARKKGLGYVRLEYRRSLGELTYLNQESLLTLWALAFRDSSHLSRQTRFLIASPNSTEHRER